MVGRFDVEMCVVRIDYVQIEVTVRVFGDNTNPNI